MVQADMDADYIASAREQHAATSGPELVRRHAVRVTGGRPAAVAACGHRYAADNFETGLEWALTTICKRCRGCTEALGLMPTVEV